METSDHFKNGAVPKSHTNRNIQNLIGMKKIIYIITSLAIFGLSNSTKAQTVTSVADGDWTSPTTWGGPSPMPGFTVIINHTVTLDIDYGYSSGSITINSSGTLNGNSLMRALAVSGGTLTVNGTLNVARVALFSGIATNSGTFQNDSLLNATSLTNNSGATINAAQFMINTGGTFNNNGSVVSTNFLNTSTVTSSGAITSYDLMNSKSFTNAATGAITVNHNFLNSDSLASPAVFTNDGSVTVNNDWRNTDQINGSGKFCIQNNTNNSGTMSGTFDFCDLTGGNIDLNTGTIAGTITYCLYSCSTGMNENLSGSIINAYPNPSSGVLSIIIKNVSANVEVEIFTMLGESIYSIQINSEKADIDLSKQAKGIYFYQIKSEKGIINTGKIIIE